MMDRCRWYYCVRLQLFPIGNKFNFGIFDWKCEIIFQCKKYWFFDGRKVIRSDKILRENLLLKSINHFSFVCLLIWIVFWRKLLIDVDKFNSCCWLLLYPVLFFVIDGFSSVKVSILNYGLRIRIQNWLYRVWNNYFLVKSVVDSKVNSKHLECL